MCEHLPTQKALRYLFIFENHGFSGASRDLVYENMHLYQAPSLKSWSKDDWNTKICDGISVGGSRVQIRNNVLENIGFGIGGGMTEAVIEDNRINLFCGDALRATGSKNLWQRNYVTNCIRVSANHDDMFQSWDDKDCDESWSDCGGIHIHDVTARHNIFVNYDAAGLAESPYISYIQGFGLFDGYFDNFNIEENLIIVSSAHGCSIYGARNSGIRHNTAIDCTPHLPNNTKASVPWVRFNNHKNGDPSVNSVVENNVGKDFNCGGSLGPAEDGCETDNKKIEEPGFDSLFKSPFVGDFKWRYIFKYDHPFILDY